MVCILGKIKRMDVDFIGHILTVVLDTFDEMVLNSTLGKIKRMDADFIGHILSRWFNIC